MGANLANDNDLRALADQLNAAIKPWQAAPLVPGALIASAPLDVTNPADRRQVVGRWQPADAATVEKALANAVAARPVSLDGSGDGDHAGALIAGGSGTGSKNAASVATPATPSAMAWCILMKNPTRSSGRPVSSHISHSGRAPSNGRRRSVSQARRSCRSSPGGGTGCTSTCSAMSNDRASAHTGHPSPVRGQHRT